MKVKSAGSAQERPMCAAVGPSNALGPFNAAAEVLMRG
jgi:hypothetical protein